MLYDNPKTRPTRKIPRQKATHHVRDACYTETPRHDTTAERLYPGYSAAQRSAVWHAARNTNAMHPSFQRSNSTACPGPRTYSNRTQPSQPSQSSPASPAQSAAEIENQVHPRPSTCIYHEVKATDSDLPIATRFVAFLFFCLVGCSCRLVRSAYGYACRYKHTYTPHIHYIQT